MMSNSPKFIAHRGLSGRFPENTHAAFRAAWEADCDGIELDIQVTKDGQVVVIHDPDTLRTSGKEYLIAETNYADLLHLNVGIGGKGGGKQFVERIPLLRNVVDDVPPFKIIQIEIKHQIENMDAVIKALYDLPNDLVVQVISFDPDKLIHVRRHLPKLDCFLVMDEQHPVLDNRLAFAVENQLAGLDMDYNMADANYVREVLDAGLQVAHWTVNDVDDAKRLIAQGAQFIASDFADKLKYQKPTKGD